MGDPMEHYSLKSFGAPSGPYNGQLYSLSLLAAIKHRPPSAHGTIGSETLVARRQAHGRVGLRGSRECYCAVLNFFEIKLY
jgi:hypothetical protein